MTTNVKTHGMDTFQIDVSNISSSLWEYLRCVNYPLLGAYVKYHVYETIMWFYK